MRTTIAGLAALTVLVFLTSAANAQSPPVVTKISVTEIHCQGCVKKLATQLSKVPGVGGVQGDIATATLYVTHQPGVNPSPKGMWEAVVKGDHKPTRMEGPSGVFTQKPQQ